MIYGSMIQKNQALGQIAISVPFYTKLKGILMHYANQLGNIKPTPTVLTQLCLSSADHGQLPTGMAHI